MKKNLSKGGSKNNPGQSNPEQDKALRAVLNVMVIGGVAIICVSIWAAIGNGMKIFWSVAGLSIIIGLSSILCGGFFGFLFGIPRSLQKSNAENLTAVTTANLKERTYSNNTNLEQISDWLTKIIVGVSLTQLPAIQKGFDTLATRVANGFTPAISIDFAYPYVSGVMLFCAICGFLAVYLWSKIYLLQQLVLLDGYLDDTINKKLENFETRVNTQSVKLEISKLESQVEDFNRVKNMLKIVESKPEFKSIVEVARPNPVKYIDDCQKDRWGGQAVSGGFRLEATFNKSNLPDDTYEVTITVRPNTKDVQLAGSVYFFLHDSYYPECIMMVPAANNFASITIGSSEAFTVGAVCNNGLVKLELDLNIYTNTPDDYKYKDPLKNYEEVKQKLDGLHKQLSPYANEADQEQETS
jgi:hypothetical protein